MSSMPTSAVSRRAPLPARRTIQSLSKTIHPRGSVDCSVEHVGELRLEFGSALDIRVTVTGPRLAFAADCGTSIGLAQQCPNSRQTLFGIAVVDGFRTDIKYLMQVVLAIGHERGPATGRFIKAHVVGVFAGNADVLIDDDLRAAKNLEHFAAPGLTAVTAADWRLL